MKYLVFVILLTLVSQLDGVSQAGFDWAQSCGHPYYGQTESLLAGDGQGNVFMAGNFIETAVFGSESITSVGGTDLFITKYNSSGDVLWLFRDGGNDDDYLKGIVANGDGFYTAGTFYGTTSIGSETYTSMGSQDIFICRYDTEGNILWSKHIGSAKTDYINALDIDVNGDLIITGHFYDDIDFGDTVIYAVAGSDIFLAKYNDSGERLWLRQAGGSSSDQSYSLSCDDYGNFIFSGSYFYDIQIGDTLLSTDNPTGVFMAKMNTEGVLIYAIQLDGNGLSAKSFAVFDTDGNIFFTGNFTDQLNLGPYHFDAGAFNIDIFITRYTDTGNLLWADHGYGAGSDQLVSVAAGPLNDLYISGHFLDTIHFSWLTLDYTLCCGSEEVFMVRYTEDGSPVWGDQISGERAMGESMCKNSGDELYVSGMFQGELTFGEIIIDGGEDYSNFLTGITIGTATYIHDIANEPSLSVYPIPAYDRLYFELSPSLLTVNYELIDMSGKKIIQGKLSSDLSLDISSIPSGKYVLHIFNDEGNISESRVILKR